MPLEQAEMGITTLAMDSGLNNSRFIGDDRMAVKFFVHPKIDNDASAKEGRPIYKDETYVSIMTPGQKDSIVIRPARQMDKDRWPKHFAAYENHNEDFLEGTPLEVWPAISRGQVEELKFFGVRTVEQLAELADSHAQNFRAIQDLKSRAKLFLEAAKDSAQTEHLNSELEKRDDQIEALQLAISEQAGQIQALTEQASDSTPKRKSNSKSSGG
jgi:hypothetical protein